ncbi:MAG: hypothetical protein ABIB71_06170 [Candidatus Woesearchaeota archaeon]
MKKAHKILFLIFLFVLAFRLFFVFQTPYYSSDDAYFNLRHTEYINQNIHPIIYDDLSYGGRYIINSHIFHYVMSFFNTFFPDISFKIFPELMLAALVFFVYFLAKRITPNEHAALLAASVSAFVPITMASTLNQISVYSILLPIFFYCIACLIDIKNKLMLFLVLSIILPVIHPAGFILGFSLLFYLILISLEPVKTSPLAKESIKFSIFMGILIALISYKKAFLAMGVRAVYQNIPAEVLSNYFMNINILTIIFNIGVIPLIFGAIGLVFGVFLEKKQPIFMAGAVVMSSLVLLSLKLIPFSLGLIILGIMLAAISSLAFEKIILYLEITKFATYKKQFAAMAAVVLVLTLILPVYFSAAKVTANTITKAEVEALEWISGNTNDGSVVLAGINEGNYITSIAKRKNVADTSFLMAPERYTDVKNIFVTESLVKANALLRKHKVNYVYVSSTAKRYYQIENLKYASGECFDNVYENSEATVYRFKC